MNRKDKNRARRARPATAAGSRSVPATTTEDCRRVVGRTDSARSASCDGTGRITTVPVPYGQSPRRLPCWLISAARPARGLAESAIGREGEPFRRRVLQAQAHPVGDICGRFDVIALHVDDADRDVDPCARQSARIISISANSRLAISSASPDRQPEKRGKQRRVRRKPTARPL